MSDALNIDVSHSIPSTDAGIPALMTPTALSADLSHAQPDLPLVAMGGHLTALRFALLEQELTALTQGCGIYDLGWMTQIAIRGEDRLRWLSGMVTNAVQQMVDGEGNYSFLLNAQGRIQGDAFVYREAERVVLQTEAGHAEKLLAHLDKFIIMDDVTLENIGGQVSSIGIAGPKTVDLLAQFHCVPPTLNDAAQAAMQPSRLCGIPIHLATIRTGNTVRYEMWAENGNLPTLWSHLMTVGAQPCGLEAVEVLRVLQGTPRYGVDITDRDLPQETSQASALNFSKGCYLGQEIVERIRSRGAVHRGLRQFQLHGELPSLPAELSAGGSSIGTLTSAITVPAPGGDATYALGIVRTEAITRGEALTYNGGTAAALDRSPVFPL